MIALTDWATAFDRMTETEIADTLATVHLSYSDELGAVTA